MSHLVSPGPPVDVEPDGVVYAAGETIAELADTPHNQALVESGRLVQLAEKGELTVSEIKKRATPENAAELLAAENERDKPRSSVITYLESLKEGS